MCEPTNTLMAPAVAELQYENRTISDCAVLSESFVFLWKHLREHVHGNRRLQTKASGCLKLYYRLSCLLSSAVLFFYFYCTVILFFNTEGQIIFWGSATDAVDRAFQLNPEYSFKMSWRNMNENVHQCMSQTHSIQHIGLHICVIFLYAARGKPHRRASVSWN